MQIVTHMAFIEKDLEKADLQITKEAFFRLFEQHRRRGMSMQAAYLKVESYCQNKGVKSYYSSFLSFKTAFYAAK